MKITSLADLVKDGLLFVDVAASRVNMMMQEFSGRTGLNVAEREEDVLAMAEDGWGSKEIVERPDISVAKVKQSIRQLVRQGRLKESVKKHDITERTEMVYQAVADGIQMRIADYLGMRSRMFTTH